MAYGLTSGQLYAPFASDLVMDALERCGIDAPTNKHMQSARRSSNLVLQHMANFGINLWKVDQTPTSIFLPQGVMSFPLTADVVAMYDTYRRQYQLGQPANITPAFVATLGSASILVNMPNPGVAVGNYISIPIQIGIGGIILFGFYQVTSTPSASSFTINAAAVATANDSGGIVPAFTTTAGNAAVTVALAAHGLLAGQPFQVPVSTMVGGIQIFGTYTVQTVIDANTFTITATATPYANDTQAENGGMAQVAAQLQSTQPSDVLMTPFSRNDYAALSNKFQPGAPTSYWFERTTIPQIWPWPVTDYTGPYELRTYLMRQIEFANPTGGQVLDIVNRFNYAFTATLAKDLSIKFAPDKYALLKGESDAAMQVAMDADREMVSTFLMPDVQGYFRG